MAEVILKNIFKIYDGNINAVNDLNLEVRDKEFMVLVGPSGCGKSTTLRMIAGLEEISKGEIYIGDRMVNDVAPKDRDIAMVFQNYALYPHMSVFDNMAFGLKLRKHEKTEIKKRVYEAAEILGLSDMLNRRPKALSGGQRQRVAVGRAIVRKPKVFLFDEPLSNLDAKLRVQMRLEISRLHQQLETTIIYVTHDQTEAMTMGDRISILNDGVMQQVDTPLNLYNKPENKFVAGFIGSPAMNFFEGKLINNEGLWFQNELMGIKIPENILFNESNIGNNIIVGIRPEHFILNDIDDKVKVKFKATIEVIEPMGSEIYLYLKSAEQHLIIRCTSDSKPILNQQINVFVEIDKIHFFDKKSGKNLIN